MQGCKQTSMTLHVPCCCYSNQGSQNGIITIFPLDKYVDTTRVCAGTPV